MISKAAAKFVRISPRKVRYVIDLIRKKKVKEAQGILNGSPRRAREIVQKLLNQAVDAAVKNSQSDVNHLFISKITADGGPVMKRFRAASMGRASSIRKRTSHITLELDLAKHQGIVESLKGSKKAKHQAQRPLESSSAKKTSTKKTDKKLVGAK